MYDFVCGPTTRSMPSLIAGLPARPMPAIRPVLDADVRLDDADHGVDDERPGRTSSSDSGRVSSHWAIRERRFFA